MPNIIAAIQMCSSSSVEKNLQYIELQIKEAASNGAKLIVLPEMFAIMGNSGVSKVEVKEKYGEGKIQSCLSSLAKLYQVWIVGGTIPIEAEDNRKIKAASLVYDDKGECVARYDKIHLFDVVLSDKEIYKESDTTEPGDSLIVFDSPFGKIGLAVCYDIRFPEMFRYFFNQGVEIILLPTAFTEKTGKAHWEILARSRAIENLCYFVGACQGGTHSSGRKTFGHSLIVGPWGDVISTIDGTESGIIYAEIDLKVLNEARKSIPIKEHQRIFIDTSLLDNLNNVGEDQSSKSKYSCSYFS